MHGEGYGPVGQPIKICYCRITKRNGENNDGCSLHRAHTKTYGCKQTSPHCHKKYQQGKRFACSIWVSTIQTSKSWLGRLCHLNFIAAPFVLFYLMSLPGSREARMTSPSNLVHLAIHHFKIRSLGRVCQGDQLRIQPAISRKGSRPMCCEVYVESLICHLLLSSMLCKAY